MVIISEGRLLDFPDGAVDKNLPAIAENVSSIPGPERFHLLWGNRTCVPLLLSLHALEPCAMKGICNTEGIAIRGITAELDRNALG